MAGKSRNSGKGSSSRKRGSRSKTPKRAAKPAKSGAAAKPAGKKTADDLEKRVGSAKGADKPEANDTREVKYLRTLLSAAKVRVGVETLFWAYADGLRDKLTPADRKALGDYAGPVKMLLAHGANSAERKYLSDNYVKGVKEKGKKERVYKTEVGDEDKKALGSLAVVAELVCELKKKAEGYDKKKAEEAEARNRYDERKAQVMEHPYAVLSEGGRNVEELVSGAVEKPAERKKLLAEMKKDPGVVLRTAAEVEPVREALVVYTQEDGKDTPLTGELNQRLGQERESIAMSALYAEIDAVVAADPRAAAKVQYKKPANGSGNGGNGNGGGKRPKKK